MGGTDAIVVGGGIIGLTAAVRLQERGARVTVWAAQAPGSTVSSVAAAVWYPSHAAPDPRLVSWAATTFEEFGRQAGAGVPGVLLRDTRMLLRGDPVLPWWAPAGRDVALAGADAPYTGQLLFRAPLVEMDPYLAWLSRRVSDGGGRIVRRAVTRLAEATDEAPVVVNATGLAAGALCGDPAVFAARGHVLLIANPGLAESVRDEDDPAGVTYVHPRRRDIVLGGTYQPGRWDTVADPADRAGILRRCTALVPRLAGLPVLGERVGLRPGRHGGPRVAAQTVAGGRRIVHAYGHGGAGMTLAWGCADEVAALALDGF
jgi:D-amino-acid oxidase